MIGGASQAAIDTFEKEPTGLVAKGMGVAGGDGVKMSGRLVSTNDVAGARVAGGGIGGAAVVEVPVLL